MGSRYWIKLYHEILNDPKVMTLPDRLFRRMIELFLFAGELDRGGLLPDVRQIAWRLRLPVDELIGDLEQLRVVGIIDQVDQGWDVIHFAERQDHSTSTERVRAFREKNRKRQYNGSETLLEPIVSQIRTDTDQKEKEKEKEILAPVAPASRFEKIYRAVTNQITIPNSEIDPVLGAIETIMRAKGFDDNQTVEYLRPYYRAFQKKYGQRSARCFWVTDWAISGNDPEELAKAPRANGRGEQVEKVYRDVNGNMISA